ncbi:hypothetical protein [Aeromicrobium sp. 179-A 4D2 NHS]|uniref:hypothetical protein n=1 Tax=Aeromicrobium sp. 179-A 4D2 NHS TaxID=3142375 RepID=UPI0039A3BCE6
MVRGIIVPDMRSASQDTIDRHGLMSLAEASEIVGYSQEATLILVRRGDLLAIDRSGRPRFPGFQFCDGQVAPEIKYLNMVAMLSEMDSADLFFWMVRPCPQLEDETPADVFCYDPERVLAVARNVLNSGW